MFFTSKKGIGPTLAIIFLLILTVSAAGTAFYWLSLVDNQLEAEEQINVKEFGPLEGEVKIVASRYDASLGDLILFVENVGSTPVPTSTAPNAPTTLWILKESQQNVICSTDWSGTDSGPVCEEGCSTGIASGELRRLVLSNLGTGALCDVENQQTGNLILYTIDFSNKAVTTSGFVR